MADGMAWPGMAWHGMAWRGMAWDRMLGPAGSASQRMHRTHPGKAGQGRAGRALLSAALANEPGAHRLDLPQRWCAGIHGMGWCAGLGPLG